MDDKDLDEDLERAIPRHPQDAQLALDAFEVLTKAKPIHPMELGKLLQQAAADDTQIAAPLVLAAGELRLMFDGRQQLRIMIALVRPFADSNPELLKSVQAATKYLNAAELPAAVGQRMADKLRQEFARAQRSLGDDYLQQHASRVLLDGRHYCKRQIDGAVHVRASLTPYAGAVDQPIPTYLPDKAAAVIPMFEKLDVRIIAELLIRQDQQEAHPHALRVVALARRYSPPSFKR